MTGRPLVILQHEAIGPPGGIATALRHLGVPFEVRRCDLGEPLPTWPTDTSGVISLGGYMHVTQRDEFPFLAEEQDLLRRILDDGGPIWGICLGAQLLTLAAGGEVRRRATPAVGWATHSSKASGGVSSPSTGASTHASRHLEPSSWRKAPAKCRRFVSAAWAGPLNSIPRWMSRWHRAGCMMRRASI